jgi:porin
MSRGHGRGGQELCWSGAKRLAVACLACIPLPSPSQPIHAEPIHGEPANAIEASPAQPAAQEHRGETKSSSLETHSSSANVAFANAFSLNGWIKPPEWLDLQLRLQAQPLANPRGGLEQSASWMQQLTLDLQLGPGLRKPLAEWREGDHWRGHLELGLFSGQPNWWQQIGAAFPLQATASPNGLWLTEASVERRPGTGGLALKAGLFALDPDWVTAPVLNAYVHSALDNSLNLNVTGLPINPAVAPGLQVSWTPGADGQWGSWQLGGFWLDPVDELAGLFGVNPGLAEVRGSAQLLQWRYQRLPGWRQAHTLLAHPGGPVPRLLPPPLLQLGGLAVLSDHAGGSTAAFTGSLTAAVPLPLGLDNRLWLGVNAGQEHSSNKVPLFLAGGWLSQGPLPGRPRDVLAIGYGRSRLNPQLVSGRHPHEAVLELNYSWQLNQHLSLQPVLQLILSPDGRNAAPILATGLGLNLRF